MGSGRFLIVVCAATAWGQQRPSARGESMLPPVPLMRCQQPQPTQEALLAHLAGMVTMSLTVDDEGMPDDIRVSSPLGLGLDESAIACMGQSRFSPARRDGKSVPTKMSVSLDFQNRWNSDWHLGKAVFHPPEGAERPIFVQATYPAASTDQRAATVGVRMVIDPAGVPAGVQLTAPQDSRLDKQAVAIASGFRFKPGTRNGRAVEVPATFDLVHGANRR